MTFNPYLTFNGNCAEAFARYAEIFGAEIGEVMKFGDAPSGVSLPPISDDLVMHAQLNLGDSVLMGSDMSGSGETKYSGIQIQMGYDDVDEARRVFEALAEGGEVEMPFEKTFWAAGFGMVRDRFGVPWMINCNQPAA